MESAGSLLQFHRLIEQARPPQRADRAAAGTLPTRAYRYCDAVTSAAGYGWWLFPPMDLQLIWDGHDVFWYFDGASDWMPLSPSAQFPDFSETFDGRAPAKLQGCAPPFLTSLPEPGTLQIWTGLMARTAPDWSSADTRTRESRQPWWLQSLRRHRRDRSLVWSLVHQSSPYADAQASASQSRFPVGSGAAATASSLCRRYPKLYSHRAQHDCDER